MPSVHLFVSLFVFLRRVFIRNHWHKLYDFWCAARVSADLDIDGVTFFVKYLALEFRTKMDPQNNVFNIYEKKKLGIFWSFDWCYSNISFKINSNGFSGKTLIWGFRAKRGDRMGPKWGSSSFTKSWCAECFWTLA